MVAVDPRGVDVVMASMMNCSGCVPAVSFERVNPDGRCAAWAGGGIAMLESILAGHEVIDLTQTHSRREWIASVKLV